MTPSSMLYAILSLQRGGGPTVWESCEALLPWLAPDCDVIAATLPGSYLERRLQGRLDAAHLFLHPLRPREPAVSEPSLSRGASDGASFLGDRDADIRTAPLLPWPAPVAREASRVRTLDTLYAETHRPGLIVVEHAAAAPSILAGARTLLRHAPALVICFASTALADRAALWERCVAALEGDYSWLDGLLLPAATAERRAEAVTVCANAVACALPRALVATRIAPGALQAATPEQLSIAAVAWNDWATHVPRDRTRDAHLAVPFDDALPAYGLHPAETDPSGHCWRWTGPSAHARFLLPVVAAGPWYVRLEVFNWGVAADASEVRVFVDGRPLASDQHGPGGARFGKFTIAPQEAPGVLTVDIITPPTRRASEDDPRRIGVNFSRCILERAA
jgi:hypothetical protein